MTRENCLGCGEAKKTPYNLIECSRFHWLIAKDLAAEQAVCKEAI